MPRTYTRRPVIDRIFDAVEDIDGHWIWTGQVGSSGYGQIIEGGHDGATVSVHRTVWEHFRGPIPKGLELDHLDSCLRLRCCHPDCLDPVPHAVNMARRTARIWRCRNGHDYTPENTRIDKQGHRNCRRCSADRERERRRRQRAARQAATADRCGRGHLRTPENTWWRDHGPTCRDCLSESAVARAHREGPEVRRERALRGSAIPAS